VKPGEHVYVIFEDSEFKHGLWINKVAGHEGVNLVVGQSQYDSMPNGRLAPKFGIAGANSADDPDNTDKFAGESSVENLKLAEKFGLGGG